MTTKELLEDFDGMIAEFDRKVSGKAPKVLRKNHAEYLVVGIAFFIIALGIIAAAFFNVPSQTGGFVIVDLTTHRADAVDYAENMDISIADIECEDGMLCAGWKEWSRHETEEPEPAEVAVKEHVETVPITGSAVASGASKPDILWIAVYIIAFLCLITIFAYILDMYLKGSVPNTSWLVWVYWLVMVGLPLSIYYAVTRNTHLVTAYVAFGASLISLVVLVLEKPWSSNELVELKNVNKLLAESSYDVRSGTRGIKQRKKEKVFPKFIERIRQAGRERKFRIKGVKEDELGKINKGIAPLAKGPEAGEAMALEVAESIAEREKRLWQLNQSLEHWVEKRRKREGMFVEK